MKHHILEDGSYINMEENIDLEQEKQDINKPTRDEKGRLLPGNTANPNGRPKGKSMKEFARQFLMAMTDEKKIEFLNSLDPSIVWRMAEGNPANETSIEGEIRHPIYLPSELLKKHDIPQITESDSE